jgi:hypothetical protein
MLLWSVEVRIGRFLTSAPDLRCFRIGVVVGVAAFVADALMKHIAVVIVLPALTEAGAAARRCQEEKADDCGMGTMERNEE